MEHFVSQRSVFTALTSHPNIFRTKAFQPCKSILGEAPMKTPAKDLELSY